jgi:hypothetical protein
MVQLHLAGGVKLKDLSRLFDMSYQYCSNTLGRYKCYGVNGLIEQTEKRYRNRKKIDEVVGQLILDLRKTETPYEQISQIIRFRHKMKIQPQSIRAWMHKQDKNYSESELEAAKQLDLYEEDTSDIVEEKWRRNSYAGSMILYAMIEWSGFLRPFEEYIFEEEEQKKSGWGVRRVLLTLYFLHALRCKSIEQSKHLVGDDFKDIVGGNFLRLQWLRYAVDAIVTHPEFDRAIEAYYKDVLSLTEVGDGFYYTDGHFSSYYGKRKLPKGYDPRRQMGFRGRNTVYAHNTRGEVIYFFESPTNTSLSNDIETLIEDLDGLEMELKDKTLFFDRGGYSQKCFKFLKSKEIYFITYLKNRKKERKADENKFNHYTVETEDGETVTYKIFEKEPREAQYGTVRIILLLAHDGRQIPIVTNNPCLKIENIVYLLQRRWREENCFKYMIEHFGIDLLTTYKTEVAPDKVIERTNPERQKINELIKQKQNELKQLNSALVEKLRERMKQGEKTIKEFLEEQKDLEYSIKNIQAGLDILAQKRETIPSKIEVNLKNEHVIIAQKRRLFINAIKTMNYNSEKWLQLHFKRYHVKLDETLSLIRSLWRQPGRIRFCSRRVDVELDRIDMGSMRTSLDQVLKKLKENNQLRLPDGRILRVWQK